MSVTVLLGYVLICCRVRSSFWSLLESGSACWHQSSERELLRSVLMTTCDIAAISKPWSVQLRAANLVLTEFFEQGDKERHQLKIQPQVICRNQIFILSLFSHPFPSFPFPLPFPSSLLFPAPRCGPSNRWDLEELVSAVSSTCSGRE